MKPYWTLNAVLVCLACSLACFAQSQPQSLADLVKQNKTSRKEVVNLNDDNLPFARTQEESDRSGAAQRSAEMPITAASGSASTPSGSLNASAAKQDAPKSAAPKNQKDDVKHLEEELESYRQQEQTWNGSATQYEEKLAKEQTEFRRNTYREAMANDRKNVDYFRQKIADTEAQLDQAREKEKKQKSSSDAKQ